MDKMHMPPRTKEEMFLQEQVLGLVKYSDEELRQVISKKYATEVVEQKTVPTKGIWGRLARAFGMGGYTQENVTMVDKIQTMDADDLSDYWNKFGKARLNQIAEERAAFLDEMLKQYSSELDALRHVGFLKWNIDRIRAQASEPLLKMLGQCDEIGRYALNSVLFFGRKRSKSELIDTLLRASGSTARDLFDMGDRSSPFVSKTKNKTADDDNDEKLEKTGKKQVKTPEHKKGKKDSETLQDKLYDVVETGTRQNLLRLKKEFQELNDEELGYALLQAYDDFVIPLGLVKTEEDQSYELMDANQQHLNALIQVAMSRAEAKGLLKPRTKATSFTCAHDITGRMADWEEKLMQVGPVFAADRHNQNEWKMFAAWRNGENYRGETPYHNTARWFAVDNNETLIWRPLLTPKQIKQQTHQKESAKALLKNVQIR